MEHVKVINDNKSVQKFKMIYREHVRLSDQLLKRNTDRIIRDLRRILTEQPNGIYLKSLGYLAVSKIKFNTKRNVQVSYKQDELFFFIPEDGYTAVTFHTGKRKTRAKNYSFAMSGKLKEEIKKNKSEVDYQNHYQLIKTLNITSDRIRTRRRVNKRN